MKFIIGDIVEWGSNPIRKGVIINICRDHIIPQYVCQCDDGYIFYAFDISLKCQRTDNKNIQLSMFDEELL